MDDYSSNIYSRLKPEKAIGIPIAEVDQGVIEDTYCVISSRWGETYVHRYSRLPTLYLFYPYSSLRRAAIDYTTHVCYDICLIIIVFSNLIDLAMPDSIPLLLERVTIIFYIAEAVYETIARGFIFGSYAYLKNPWMCLDFLITLLSLPDLENNTDSGFGIQSLRGIRGLHLISKIPGVQTMSQAIISSMFRMYGVAMIMVLFLLSVALAAKQLFMGIFHRRCVKDLPSDFDILNISYNEFVNQPNNWDDDHGDFIMCGNETGAQKCNENYTCLYTSIGSESVITSFDTFSLSVINSFRLLTQDEWEKLYDKIIEATGPHSFLFFLPVVFFGSFFLLNLMLVVVTSTFDSIINAKDENRPLRSYRYHSSFYFDIKQLTLYPLPTSPEELKRVFKERDEIIIHQHWLRKTWKKILDIIFLKLNINKADNLDDDENSISNWRKFRKIIKKLSDSKSFYYFILLTIIFNIFIMASEHARMTTEFSIVLRYCNVVITAIFSFEVVIHVIAYGMNYFFNWWNILDFCIVLQSIASLVLNFVAEYSIFRSLRLLELMKVQQAWPALQRVIAIILSSVANIVRLLFVMILIMFMFAVIGNRVLGPLMEKDAEVSRDSFKTFGTSLFTVFAIFAGEWFNPLDTCLALCRIPLLCIIIIIPYYLIGSLVIVNVFTAVLLGAFDAAALKLPQLQKKETIFKPNVYETDGKSYANLNNFQKDLLKFRKFVQSSKFEYIIFVLVVGSSIIMQKNADNDDESDLNPFEFPVCCVTSAKYCNSGLNNNWCRTCIQRCCVTMNCNEIHMAFEDVELHSLPTKMLIVKSVDHAFTILFIIEMLLRWFSIGIRKYFADAWMRFDFMLVLLSLVEIFVLNVFTLSDPAMDGMKAMRALRPLRLIPRWKSLEQFLFIVEVALIASSGRIVITYGFSNCQNLVVQSLVLSLPAMFYVVLVVLFIWLPFAIVGVHSFAGKFFRCVDENQETVTFIQNKKSCIDEGFRWEEMFYNFNHIGNSYLSLFQLAMFTGWTDLVAIMVDFNEEDLSPIPNNRSEYYVFVVVFVLLGAYFSLNLFVGVAVDTFKRSQKYVRMGTTDLLLTNTQRRYHGAMLRLGRRRPVMRTDRPSNRVLNFCYTVTYSLWFRVIILLLICANTVTIAMDSYQDPPYKRIILHYFDLSFTVLYTLEFVVKILGLRKYYFNDFWNIFDFILVFTRIVGDIILHHPSAEPNPLSFLYAFRLLRILRLLRLTDMLIDLRRLLHSMLVSIPALMNISMLLFLLIYIYSLFGMSLFGHLSSHGVISTKINFQNFINSYLLLFRLTTAHGWEDLLESLSLQPPYCKKDKENCGNIVLAVVFLMSFIVLSNIILVNIFIAVILDNYLAAIIQENDVINDDNLANFYKLWKQFDPKATQFIPYEKLSDFLDLLNEDMRIPKPNHIAIVYMNLPITEGENIHCVNVLKGILEVKVGDVEDSATFRILCDQVEKKFVMMFPKLSKVRFVETTMELQQREFAARVLQVNFRRMKRRRNFRGMPLVRMASCKA